MDGYELSAAGKFYWSLWERMNSFDRPVGMGLGRIPSTTIIKVLELYGLNTVESFDIICHIEQRMFSYMSEKIESERKRKTKK